MQGIEAACDAKFPGGVKINAVIQRGVNDEGVLDLLAMFRETGVVVRFIEYMDVGNRNGWVRDQVVTSRELHDRIAARWPIEAMEARYRGEVATRYRYRDGAGEIGFISSVSAPFCGDCSRARLSSEGQLYTCLFATTGTDLRTLLRESADDKALHDMLARLWRARGDRYSEERAALRATRPHEKIEMHYIGG